MTHAAERPYEPVARPRPDVLADLPDDVVQGIRELAERLATEPERVEFLVRVEFPESLGRHIDEYPMESAHGAYLLGTQIARDYGLLGTGVMVTPLRQVWVLAQEEEIEDPLAELAQRAKERREETG